MKIMEWVDTVDKGVFLFFRKLKYGSLNDENINEETHHDNIAYVNTLVPMEQGIF